MYPLLNIEPENKEFWDKLDLGNYKFLEFTSYTIDKFMHLAHIYSDSVLSNIDSVYTFNTSIRANNDTIVDDDLNCTGSKFLVMLSDLGLSLSFSGLEPLEETLEFLANYNDDIHLLNLTFNNSSLRLVDLLSETVRRNDIILEGLKLVTYPLLTIEDGKLVPLDMFETNSSSGKRMLLTYMSGCVFVRTYEEVDHGASDQEGRYSS